MDRPATTSSPPAALHLGLLARGGDRERFLRDAASADGS
jgi:hypothetical protein